MDTSEEIDQSFGDGPPHRPVAERIVAGRRHVVRRRMGLGACAAATALVVGGAGWALAPGPTPSTGPDAVGVANQDAKQANNGGANRDPVVNRDLQRQLMKGELATYASNGTLVIRNGWHVAQRLPNPLGLQPPNKSVGLELTNGTKTYWYLLDLQGNGSASASDPAGKGFNSLNAWVADQVALQSGGQPTAPVEFRAGTAELVAVNGATIVRQHSDPNVSGFAEPGDTTAVAQVEWKGATYFVLARQVGGSADYFPTRADVPPRPMMTSFLDYASQQYGSNEGLR